MKTNVILNCMRCDELSIHKQRDGKYMPVDYGDGHAWLFVCPHCKADIETDLQTEVNDERIRR